MVHEIDEVVPRRAGREVPERLGAILRSKRLGGVLWGIGAAMAVFWLRWTLVNAVGTQEPWDTAAGRLLDYRDTVIHTTQFMLAGGNPYDPDTFLKAYPWSQEFDPYAPLWLVLIFPLGILSLKVGGAIFVAILLAGEAWAAVALAEWALPRHAAALAPMIFIWMMIWSPTRIVGPSTVIYLALLGVCLALRSQRESWIHAGLAALCCIKPQFGIPLFVYLLALGRVRTVLRGTVVLLMGSLIPLILVVKSAGGVIEFADSIRRDIAYASSEAAPTGIGSEINFRTDIPGLLARLGVAEVPGSLQLAFVAIVMCLVLFALRRTKSPEIQSVLIVSSILILPVHADYDVLLITIAGAASFAWWMGHPSALSALMMASCILPVLHLHRISRMSGLSLAQVETADVFLEVTAMVFAFVLALQHGFARRLGPRSREDRDPAGEL